MQKAEHKAAAGKVSETQGDTPDYSEGKYGPMKMIQSDDKRLERVFVKVGDLSKHVGAKSPVWVRGRVHTTRSKGKQCFLVLRQQSSTVQVVIAVSDVISKQMVKFSGRFVSLFYFV